MYIRINTITQQRQARRFYLHITDLENAFDIMRTIAYQDELVAMSYFDQQGELPISLDTLYSLGSLNPVGQLRQQWESILTSFESIELTVSNPRSQPNQHLISLQQDSLRHAQQVHQQMQQILETTQATLPEGPQRTRLVNTHYRTIQRLQWSIAELEVRLEGV